MIIQLGSSTEFIRVTAEYSNAVLLAMLPHVADFAKKVELPLPNPLTVEHVEKSAILPWRDKDGGIAGGSIFFKDGWHLGFNFGHVSGFANPNCYFGLQNPDQIPKYFGTVRMTTNEAVALARNTIRKSGIPLEKLYADLDPYIPALEKVGTNVVPRYRIKWQGPDGGETVELEINADKRRVESFHLNSRHLWKPPPKVSVIPPRGNGFGPYRPPSINPEYAWKLIPFILRAVDDYGKVLSLPIPRPLTTNHVARFEVYDNGGWPATEMELTNGWRFVYRNSMVNGCYWPNHIFSSRPPPALMKDLSGKWRLNETQAIELVKRTLAKFNYPTNLLDMGFAPQVSKPALPGIPRYLFYWWKPNAESNDLVCKVEAEVDADKGELTSLYYDHTAYWNKPPPIDVPISLRQPAPNAVQGDSRIPLKTTPSRPFKPLATNDNSARQEKIRAK